MSKGTYETLRCGLFRDPRLRVVNHSSSQTYAVSDYSPPAVRPRMGCLLQDCRRYGFRRRAYKDVFTARLEKDIPYPGE